MKSYQSVIIAIVSFLILFVIVSNFTTVVDYESYEGETTAVVSDINTKCVYSKAYNYLTYQITYSYNIDGKTYESQTLWITEVPELENMKIGQEIKIQYDKNNPKSSMLKLEKNNSVTRLWLFLIVILAIVIISKFNDRKEKNIW